MSHNDAVELTKVVERCKKAKHILVQSRDWKIIRESRQKLKISLGTGATLQVDGDSSDFFVRGSGKIYCSGKNNYFYIHKPHGPKIEVSSARVDGNKTFLQYVLPAFEANGQIDRNPSGNHKDEDSALLSNVKRPSSQILSKKENSNEVPDQDHSRRIQTAIARPKLPTKVISIWNNIQITANAYIAPGTSSRLDFNNSPGFTMHFGSS
jgi:hypothetical protein